MGVERQERRAERKEEKQERRADRRSDRVERRTERRQNRLERRSDKLDKKKERWGIKDSEEVSDNDLLDLQEEEEDAISESQGEYSNLKDEILSEWDFSKEEIEEVIEESTDEENQQEEEEISTEELSQIIDAQNITIEQLQDKLVKLEEIRNEVIDKDGEIDAKKLDNSFSSLYDDAQKAGFTGNQLEFAKVLFAKKELTEQFDLSHYPPSIIKSIEEDFINDPRWLIDAKRKLASVDINTIGTGNVGIWDKLFSILPLSKERKDNAKDPNSFENNTFAAGTILTEEIASQWRSMFTSSEKALQFIDEYIPGATPASRIRNFALLLWVPKTWYKDTLWKEVDKWSRGNARICPPNEINDKWVAIGYSDSNWTIYQEDKTYSMPIISFQDKLPN